MVFERVMAFVDTTPGHHFTFVTRRVKVRHQFTSRRDVKRIVEKLTPANGETIVWLIALLHVLHL
jgi:hypothetical protein